MPPVWRTAMREVASHVFAYVQATGQTGISNAGLIVGAEGAVAVDALMVPSMTRVPCFFQFFGCEQVLCSIK